MKEIPFVNDGRLQNPFVNYWDKLAMNDFYHPTVSSKIASTLREKKGPHMIR